MSKNEPSSATDTVSSFTCWLALAMYWLILSGGLQLVRLVELLLNAVHWCARVGRAVERWLER
jgi:hypothetical protein